MYTSIVHGKLSYWKYDDKICIEDDKESCYTQTDPTTQNEFISKKDFGRFLIDFEESKRYVHCEMLSIKADVASRQKSQNPPKSPDGDRKALVRTLNERILSLDKQLNEKQYVIKKLFDGPKQNYITSLHEIPSGQNNNTSPQTEANEEQKRKSCDSSKLNSKRPTATEGTNKNNSVKTPTTSKPNTQMAVHGKELQSLEIRYLMVSTKKACRRRITSE